MALERGRESSKMRIGWAVKLSFFMPYDCQMGCAKEKRQNGTKSIRAFEEARG
jgi:hypothetical protein